MGTIARSTHITAVLNLGLCLSIEVLRHSARSIGSYNYTAIGTNIFIANDNTLHVLEHNIILCHVQNSITKRGFPLSIQAPGYGGIHWFTHAIRWKG